MYKSGLYTWTRFWSGFPAQVYSKSGGNGSNLRDLYTNMPFCESFLVQVGLVRRETVWCDGGCAGRQGCSRGRRQGNISFRQTAARKCPLCALCRWLRCARGRDRHMAHGKGLSRCGCLEAWGWGRTRFRGAALAASRGRPRGSGQPFGAMQPSVLRTSSLFPLSDVGQASLPVAVQQKQPAACAAGCIVPKGLRRGRDS